MKIFFLLVSVGLFASTLTGIFMAYKFNRNKFVVIGLLLAGIILYPAVGAAKTCPTIDWKGFLSFQEVSPDG